MACLNVDPRIFDEKAMRTGRPRKDGSTVRPQQDWTEAAETCAGCSVKQQCLEWVLAQPRPIVDKPGSRHYAAGYTPDQLEKIRRQREAQKMRRRTA